MSAQRQIEPQRTLISKPAIQEDFEEELMKMRDDELGDEE
jgi:hypothetical protein